MCAYLELNEPNLAAILEVRRMLVLGCVFINHHVTDELGSLDEEVRRLAEYKQTSVSLKATLDTGLGLLLPHEGARALAP